MMGRPAATFLRRRESGAQTQHKAMSSDSEVRVQMHRYAKHRLRDVNQKLGALQDEADLEQLAEEIAETADELEELSEELQEVTA